MKLTVCEVLVRKDSGNLLVTEVYDFELEILGLIYYDQATGTNGVQVLGEYSMEFSSAAMFPEAVFESLNKRYAKHKEIVEHLFLTPKQVKEALVNSVKNAAKIQTREQYVESKNEAVKKASDWADELDVIEDEAIGPDSLAGGKAALAKQRGRKSNAQTASHNENDSHLEA